MPELLEGHESPPVPIDELRQTQSRYPADRQQLLNISVHQRFHNTYIERAGEKSALLLLWRQGVTRDDGNMCKVLVDR